MTAETETIRASKYRKLSEQQGSYAAIEALAQDVGSEGDFNIRKTPADSAGAGRLAASISDIHAVDADSDATSTLRGVGTTPQTATDELLENLLAPERDLYRVGVQSAHLVVGFGDSKKRFVVLKL